MADPLDRLKRVLQDRYAIRRELGRGGMAPVHLAENRKHHRPVALKVLKPELAEAIGPDRFLEARLRATPAERDSAERDVGRQTLGPHHRADGDRRLRLASWCW